MIGRAALLAHRNKQKKSLHRKLSLTDALEVDQRDVVVNCFEEDEGSRFMAFLIEGGGTPLS